MFSHAGPSEPHPSGARTWRPWREAWVDAAYGPSGFWTTQRPADHFATAVGVGPHVSGAVAGMVPGRGVVVDVGAGDGRLLADLAELRPDLELVGVDRRTRPGGLDGRVRWVVDHWDVEHERWAAGGPDAWLDAGVRRVRPLLVAHEWLDDLPVAVVERAGAGWREVEVDPDGHERTGAAVAPDDAAWLARWWAQGGERAEVGRPRDTAWRDLVVAALARGGRALAVDYGHWSDDRPPGGTLTAYADGRQRRPAPDGRANLTAGVAVDALAATGVEVGGTTLLLARQSEVLGGADRDEPGAGGTLAALVSRSERSALVAPGRWGDLWWLLQGREPEPGAATRLA